MDTMMCGGIEKSLLSLLDAIDLTRLDVTILFNKCSGLFFKYIPEEVRTHEITYNRRIADEQKFGRKKMLLRNVSRLRLVSSIKEFRSLRSENKLKGDELTIARSRRFQDGIIEDSVVCGEYDLAVAYANFEQMILVAEKIRARRKIAFFHTELTGVSDNINCFRPIFSQFDTLYCVSKDLTLSLQLALSELKPRIKAFPHIINTGMMKDWAAKEKPHWSGKGIKLLSVGRLQRQKGFDLIPDIALRLKSSGIDFQWIIIGEGALYDDISQQIESLGLSGNVSLAGAKENPYPYFASCDIYVQPSRYEGYCLTLAEARVFARPILATHFDGANEQLEEGKCGMIVDCSVDRLSEGIIDLCSNVSLRERYSNALKSQTITDHNGARMFMHEIETACSTEF